MKKTVAMILCLVMVLSLAGCGAKNSKEESLNISIAGSPATVDPQLVSDQESSHAVSFIVSTLFVFDDDGKVCPGLADSYDVSDDGLTYTIKLKKGLCWSDGSPLTARDFVYAFRRIADPDTGSGVVYYITDYCQIKNAEDINNGDKHIDELGVSAPDETTFVIELVEPCPYMTALLTNYPLSPCNEQFFKNCKGNYATTPETLLSCGPYMIDRYEPLAVQIHYVLNPYYYDADFHKNLPKSITAQVVPNMQQAVMCFETGEFDITEVGGSILEKMSGDKRLISLNQAGEFFVQFGNMKQSDVSNAHIRRALGRSVDRDSIVKDYYKAGAYALKRISPREYYYETDGTDYSGDDSQYEDVTGFDVDAAKKEWEQGLKELGQNSLELDLAFSNSNQAICEILKQDWEKNLPGISIKLVPLPTKEWIVAMTSSKYDMTYTGWNTDYADPTGFYNYFYTGQNGDNGYSNPEVDKMLDESSSGKMASDPAKRNLLLHKIEDILLDDMAEIPLLSTQKSYLTSDGYSDLKLYGNAIGFQLSSLEHK